jgi:hypothetical protein
MDQIDFQLGGKRYQLTAQDVMTCMAHAVPEPVQTWAVDIQGRLFPVKQVLATVTGVDRNEFISHRARDLLRRLGFHVLDVTREKVAPSPAVELTATPVPRPLTDRQLSVRIAALESAVRHVARTAELPVDQVLNVAETFESWLTR